MVSVNFGSSNEQTSNHKMRNAVIGGVVAGAGGAAIGNVSAKPQFENAEALMGLDKDTFESSMKKVTSDDDKSAKETLESAHKAGVEAQENAKTKAEALMGKDVKELSADEVINKSELKFENLEQAKAHIKEDGDVAKGLKVKETQISTIEEALKGVKDEGEEATKTIHLDKEGKLVEVAKDAEVPEGATKAVLTKSKEGDKVISKVAIADAEAKPLTELADDVAGEKKVMTEVKAFLEGIGNPDKGDAKITAEKVTDGFKKQAEVLDDATKTAFDKVKGVFKDKGKATKIGAAIGIVAGLLIGAMATKSPEAE